MNYSIYRGDEIVWSGKPASGKQRKAIMQEDRVAVTIQTPEPIEFQKGDTIQVYGQRYKINRPENISRTNTRVGYSYEIEFEAQYYDLGKWMLYTLDKDNQLTNASVYLMGNAAAILGLVVQNANRVSSGWSLGVVEDTDVIQWTFTSAKLLTVLQDVADQTNLEFWVDGKVINLTRRQPDTGVTLEYGKGKGLYELQRSRRGTPVVTHMTVLGGTQNVPNGYGFRNIQPLGGNPRVNPGYTEGMDRVEDVVVFENIYPKLEAQVTHIADTNVIRSTAIDFDINDHLLDDNTSAQIVFTSGLLHGFQFNISKDGYNHALKEITFDRIVDNAYPNDVPNAVLKPAVGDTFVLLNISMPSSYANTSEQKLRDLADQYFLEEGKEQYDWTGKLTPKFVFENNVEVALGGIIRLKAADIGFDDTIRITSFERDLQQGYLYDFTLSNLVSINQLVRDRNKSDRLANAISKGLTQDGLSKKATYAERAGYAELAGHAATATNAATANFALKAQEAQHAETADKATLADLATRALKADEADYALDSDKWDGAQFADYLNQPVRTGDSPRFTGLSSPAFSSGTFGEGFRITKDGNGDYTLELDRLTVRKDFSVSELVVNKIRATNGSLWVSDGIKIQSVAEVSGGYRCTIDNDGDTIAIPFVVDDLVRCQVFTGRNVKYYTARVFDVGNDSFSLVLIDGAGIPAAGDQVVRIGNTANTNRQGSLYLTASDSGAPYLDVVDGVNSASLTGKVKARLGRLDGVVSPVWGALSGYGLYSDNAYLQNGYFSGSVNVTGGNAETKQGAQDKVDAIQVGGRNLLKGSRTMDVFGLYGVTAILANVVTPSEPSGQVFRLTDIVRQPGFANYVFFIPIANNPWIIESPPLVGEEVVVSFRAKSNSSHWFELYFGGTALTPIEIGTSWRDYAFKTIIHPADNLHFGVDGAALQTLDISSIKIERGNKFTDWTPAPEDVAVDATNKANEAERLAKEYALQQAGIAQGNAVQQAANDASNKANDAKLHADTLIKSLSVGGRNLLLNSDIERTSSSEYIGVDVYHLFTSLYGEEVTISFELKTAIDGYITVYFLGRYSAFYQSVSSTTSYQRFSVTGVVMDSDVNQHFCDLSFYGGYGSGIIPTVKNIKIEKGNKATDWTPAPEDVQQAIDEAKQLAIDADNARVALANSLKGLAFQDKVRVAMEGESLIVGGYLQNTLIDTVWINSQIVLTKEIIVEGGGATTVQLNDAINGIEVGYTNLINDGDFAISTNVSGQYNASFILLREYGDVRPFVGNKFLAASKDNGAISFMYFGLDPYINVKPSSEYVFSFSHILPFENDILNIQVVEWNGTENKYTGVNVPTNTARNWGARSVVKFTTKPDTLSITFRFDAYTGSWLLLDGVKLEQGNKATPWSPSLFDMSGGVRDTRNDNQLPTWYYDRYPSQTVRELKFSNVIGLPIGSYYVDLTTIVPWSDSSGGAVVQEARFEKRLWSRTGTGETWLDWEEKENVNGSQAKVNALQNSLGSLAYDNLVEESKLGETVIQGGYIKTTLLNVNEIFAQNITASGQITASNLVVTGNSKLGELNIDSQGYLTNNNGRGGIHVRSGINYNTSMYAAIGPDAALAALPATWGGQIPAVFGNERNSWDENIALFLSARNGDQNTAIYVDNGMTKLKGLSVGVQNITTANSIISKNTAFVVINGLAGAAGNPNLFLPFNPDVGMVIWIKNISGGGCTLQGNGKAIVAINNKASSTSLMYYGNVRTYIYDGSNWVEVNGH